MSGNAAAIETVARRESLREILSFADEACARFGVQGSQSFDVRLALEEICMNVIDHGYDGSEPGPLNVSIADEADHLVITVRDRGSRFDPDDAPQPELETGWTDRPIGGLGLHLVRQVMDELRYESSPDGSNELTLIKRKTPQEEIDGNLGA